jgi:hypothetical protein
MSNRTPEPRHGAQGPCLSAARAWSLTPLRRHRLDTGWPQWLLARQAGVSVNKVSFAERGLDVLAPADRRRLADTLGSRGRGGIPRDRNPVREDTDHG